MRIMTATFLGLGLLLSVSSAAWADEQADCKALVEKAVKARGGLDKLEKLKAGTTKTKGSFHAMGMPIPFTGTYTVQQPDKFKHEIAAEVMGVPFEVVVVFNGKEGWRLTPQGLMEFTEEQVAEQKHSLYAGKVTSLVSLLKDKDYKLTSLGESKHDGKPVVGVRVAKEGQRDVSLFFDPQSGFLVKTETRGKDPQQNTEFAAETTYADYKDIDGVKHATKQTTKRDGKLFLESEVLEIKTVDKVNDDVFSKPS